MKKRKVLFFTDTFPFGTGETFIENEMIEWGKRNDIELIIFPLLSRTSGFCRNTPSNTTIDLRLSKLLYSFEKKIAILFPVIFLNPFFWKEIFIYPKVLIKPKQLRKLVAASTFSKVIYWFMKQNYANVLSEDTIFYSYWFYYAAYGGALLKKKGLKFKLISRAHRTDIFQNRKETEYYIPFRRFPIWKNFQKIYPVSHNGADYLQTNQKIPIDILQVSYLGVREQDYVCSPSEEGYLNIVSCSFLVPVKRVDLLISNIANYAQKHNDIQINWFHLGDGPLRNELEMLAEKQLDFNNVKYSFLGNLKNTEVLEFYKHTLLDGFITTSESEGLPVSIMEAIMVGLPVISTNVGGISEAIDNNNGFLLQPNFKPNDFEQALAKILKFKSNKNHIEIARCARQKFSSEKNIGNFIQGLLNQS